MRKVCIAIIITISTLTSAQEATRWRGPEGNGVYPDQGLLRAWPADGPEMVWHVNGLGQGHSSPVFANGKIYITGMINKTGYVFVLSRDGKILDKFPFGEDFHQSYPGSRSSPTIVGDLLYVFSGQGKVVCMNTQDGMIKWSRNLFRDFDGRNITWGATETLVVDETTVYCTPGGSKDNVLALDRFTGNAQWSSKGKGNRSAYCTPLLARLPAAKILVTHTASNIVAVDASSGKLLWSHNHPNQYSVHANTPIYHDGDVYCFSGYGRGGVMIELDDRGNKVKNKLRIPNWIKNNKNLLKVCLKGLYDTDGSVYKLTNQNSHQICFTNVNQGLLQDVRDGLLNLGVNCSKISKKDIYITKKSELRKFLKLIGFSNDRHLKKVKMWNLESPVV